MFFIFLREAIKVVKAATEIGIERLSAGIVEVASVISRVDSL